MVIYSIANDVTTKAPKKWKEWNGIQIQRDEDQLKPRKVKFK